MYSSPYFMSNVTIIGGGPAGASAAVRLAQNGHSVTLFEKSTFPRPKLCGGFLSHEALECLSELDVLRALKVAGAVRLSRAVLASCGGTVVESALPGESLSVTRDVLDDLLLRQAAARGVTVKYEDYDDRSVRSGEITVMAGGRLGALRERWPLTPWYASPSTPYFGIQASFEDVDDVTDQVELDLIESGYVGLARQSDRLVNICALTTPLS